jgi:hypothetical protein
MTTATRITRQFAAGALLVGGLAAFVSSFLPFGKATYHADLYLFPGQPIRVVFYVPAQDLIGRLQPYGPAIVLIWGFVVWGIPLVLLTLGAAALWQRPGRPQATEYFVGLLLLLIGAGYTLLTRISFDFYLYPSIAYVNVDGFIAQTVEYGSLVTLLGYLSAFVAIVWLRSERNSPASHP